MQFDHECNLINFHPDICVHTYMHREFAYYVVYESLYSLIRTSECIKQQFDSGMQHKHPTKKNIQIVNIHQNYCSNRIPPFLVGVFVHVGVTAGSSARSVVLVFVATAAAASDDYDNDDEKPSCSRAEDSPSHNGWSIGS